MRPAFPPSREALLRFVRSLVAGAGATLADLAVLFVLVAAFRVDPRLASLPALVAGGVANFFLNRHFAFRARRGHLGKQAVGYTIVEIAALVLNGVLFDLVLRLVPQAAAWYGVVRLVTTNVVFLGFSYPLWRRVFSVPREDAMA